MEIFQSIFAVYKFLVTALASFSGTIFSTHLDDLAAATELKRLSEKEAEKEPFL